MSRFPGVAVCIASLACFFANAAQADTHAYLLTPVTFPAGVFDVQVLDMNNSNALSGVAIPQNSTLSSIAIYWKNPASPVLPDASATIVPPSGDGLNDAGDVCGGDHGNAIFWSHHATASRLPGLRWNNENGCAEVNSAGTKVGWSMNGDAVRAVRWDSNGVHDLGALGDRTTWSHATSISPSGIITGWSEVGPDSDGAPNHPVMWPAGGSIVDLGTFGGPAGIAYSANDSGQVVGTAAYDIQLAGYYLTRAALWEGGAPQDLGTAGGQYSSTAFSINASGLIVGSSYTLENYDKGHATLWDHGSIVDLTALLAPQVPSNHRLTAAMRINNKGNILLAGINTSSGKNVYYLGTAVSPTHVSLSSSENPSRSGDSVLFVATVTADSGSTPTSSVTFKDGTAVLGTSLLDSSGRAVLRTSLLSVGTHPITASFAGLEPFGPSTSSVLNQVVRYKLVPVPPGL